MQMSGSEMQEQKVMQQEVLQSFERLFLLKEEGITLYMVMYELLFE
jgi:hypothetical protein